MCPDHR
jgi:hypothetical protein